MLPILITAYNRANSLKILMESIQSQPHGPIYIHCDGIRSANDRAALETAYYAKKLFENGEICNLHIQDTNLGLMRSIQFAADWFFSLETFGLIVEDDLILHPPVLMEAEKLFQDFKDFKNFETFSISNPLPKKYFFNYAHSYWISNFFVSCGWATSRENWNKSHKSMSEIDNGLIKSIMTEKFGKGVARNFAKFLREENLRELNNSRTASFAWRYSLSQLQGGTKTAILTRNRIGYTGFGLHSTNTSNSRIHGTKFGHEVDLNFEDWRRPINYQSHKSFDRYFVRDFTPMRSFRITLGIKTRLRKFFRKFNFSGTRKMKVVRD